MIRTERQELLRCLTSWSLVPEEIKGENGREFMRHARLLYNCQKTGKVVFGRRGGYKLTYDRQHLGVLLDDKCTDKRWRAKPGTIFDSEFLAETAEIFGIRPDAIESATHTSKGIELVITKDSLNFYGRGYIPYQSR
jgi:hypothetical protein